jgi:hypothetical protein
MTAQIRVNNLDLDEFLVNTTPPRPQGEGWGEATDCPLPCSPSPSGRGLG